MRTDLRLQAAGEGGESPRSRSPSAVINDHQQRGPEGRGLGPVHGHVSPRHPGPHRDQGDERGRDHERVRPRVEGEEVMSAADTRFLAERQRLLNRRWFLRDCGVGLGAIALNGLLAGARADNAPSGQGQARHLPVHGRCAEPPGTVRQQAAAREVQRHAAAAGVAQELPGRVHQPELQAPRAEVQVQEGRQERHRTRRTPARTSATWWTTSPS